VSRRGRRALFLLAALALGGLFVWGLAGLPDFGHYRGPYGKVLARVAVPQRKATDVVGAVTFDYRGFDTMGEEFILFAAALGLVALLREQRGEHREGEEHPADRRHRETSPALRALGLALVGPFVVLGLYVVAHGHLTPGGGFQGGVILAAALVLVHLVGRTGAMERVRPIPLVELAEAAGAGGFVALGLGGLIAGAAFLSNFIAFGSKGSLLSGGTIPLLNLSVGIEVAGALTLIIGEFLDQRLARDR